MSANPRGPAPAPGSPWALACLGLGALLALLPAAFGPGAGAARSPTERGGPVALWAADRDAQLVVQLDRDLFVVGERRLPHPVRVAPTAGGGAWVACALEGRPRGAHRLVLLDRTLRELARVELGAVLDLSAGPGEEVFVLEAPRRVSERVLRIAADGSLRTLFELPGARRLAAGEGWIAAADGEGRLECLGPDGERTAVELPGPLGPLVAVPGGWWLVFQESRSLVRLTHGGSPLAVARLAAQHPRLAGCPDGGLWLSGGPPASLERRGADGAPKGRSAGLDPALLRGPLLGLGPERVLFAGPGALVLLDGAGRARLGQGGFVGLADVAAARGAGSGVPRGPGGPGPEG